MTKKVLKKRGRGGGEFDVGGPSVRESRPPSGAAGVELPLTSDAW